MGDENAITLISKIDFGDPLYLHASDTTNTPLISIKLKGTENYNVRSRAMLLALCTKIKVGFVNGTYLKNNDNVVLGAQCDRCNSVVLSWLLNSISEELYSGQIFSNIASVVWTELKETYDKVDGSIIFNLHHKISSLKQSGSSLSEYYHKLNTLWKQYDEMVKLPAYVCDVAPEFQKHNKVLKLMQFLMGLDDVYMSTRSNLLLRDPLPDVKSAFAMLSREESHREVSGIGTSKSQNSAFVAQTNNNSWSNRNNNTGSSGRGRGFNRGLNPNLKCTNCAASDSLSGSTSSSSNSGATNASNFVPMTLSNEKMMKLLSMLNDKDPQATESVSNMSGTIMNNNVFFNNNFHKFFNFNSGLNRSQGWIIDSGASQHMTASEHGLDNIVDVSDLNLQVSHPNGTKAKVKKIGNLRLNKDILLTDVLIVPGYCDLKTRTTLGTGSVNGGLYVFDYLKGDPLMCNSMYACNFESVLLWHNRLGHRSSPVLNILKHILNLDMNVDDLPCETCLKAKKIREPFPLSDHITKELGELIHMDLWGPYRVTSREGYKYFLTIVDDYTRAVWVYLLKSKDEVFENFVNYANLLLNQFEKRIKVIRTDNGTEFLNSQMKNFTNKKGIVHQTTIAHTPQQNGLVERKHRHLLNVARSLMFQGGIPLYLWTECILTATYLINRIPSKLLAGLSPFQKIYGSEPSLSHIRNYGCLVFSKILDESDKFKPRFFDLFSVQNDTNISENPYDEGRIHPEGPTVMADTSCDFTRSGGSHSNPNEDDGHVNDLPEGTSNNNTNENHSEPTNDEHAILRRSSRQTTLPRKLSDYVVEALNAESFSIQCVWFASLNEDKYFQSIMVVVSDLLPANATVNSLASPGGCTVEENEDE
ncbi:uncharacterized protein [Rutidosis leptorrhynchoides]|uniref:uncharacterized protein n=1 Tax=Rutidosis leptorrhynchoides TaxID=125765 RepID=UPI003A995E81